MTLPEKQDLFNEIESLPQTDYAEILDFLQFLKQKKTQVAAEISAQNSAFSHQLNTQRVFLPESKQRHALMELEGLGKELWQTLETELFLEEERNAWA